MIKNQDKNSDSSNNSKKMNKNSQKKDQQQPKKEVSDSSVRNTSGGVMPDTSEPHAQSMTDVRYAFEKKGNREDIKNQQGSDK